MLIQRRERDREREIADIANKTTVSWKQQIRESIKINAL